VRGFSWDGPFSFQRLKKWPEPTRFAPIPRSVLSNIYLLVEERRAKAGFSRTGSK